MSETTVLWVTYKDGSIPRGQWDMGLLEDLFTRRAWSPVGGRTFRHVEGRGSEAFGLVPEGEGAVVVIPAQHNVPFAETLGADIARLPWCLLVLAGDEEALFDWRVPVHGLPEGARVAVWVMTPRPAGRAHHDVDGFVGEGYNPLTPGLLRDRPPPDKSLDFFFAGQVTHERRRQMATKLDGLIGHGIPGEFVRSPGFTLGLDFPEYMERMCAARIVPCPSGPGTPDSFRLYEALEAGAVPVADGHAPQYPEPGYWTMLFGTEPPFPVVSSWDEFPEVHARLTEDWTATAARVGAWWVAEKRRLAYRLEASLDRLAAPGPAQPHPGSPLRDLLTVVVTASPVPSHPSTDLVAETVDSVRAHADLAEVEVIVALDGVRPEQEELRNNYDEHQRRLAWLALHRWTNVLPLRIEEHVHQANALRAALEQVRTPLVLFMEQDTPLFGGEVDWRAICRAVLSGDFNLIRLHHEASILEPHRHLMLDETPLDLWGAPVLRTAQWSQRPHVASAYFYRDLLDLYFAPECRTMIEDVMHGVVDHAWREGGVPGWARFRLGIYAPDGDMKRSTHTDGRAGGSKFEDRWVFAYPGGQTPRGAPRANG